MSLNKLIDADTFEEIRQKNISAPAAPNLSSVFKKIPAEKSVNGVVMGVSPVAPVSPVGITCFPADSQVLMADGTTKNIQDVEVGDAMASVNSEPAFCVRKYVTILGYRKMIEFSDKSLKWSEEHAFWTRDKSGKEWWWSYNPDQWRFEVDEGVIGGLKDNFSIRTGAGFQFATIDGWKSQEFGVTEESYDFNYPLYLPVTNGPPIIVNGYVVGACVNEYNFDYTAIKWQGCACEAFV